MSDELEDELKKFTQENTFRGKGPLSVALVVTQHARQMGLPLVPDELVTRGGGQVYGLGKGAVQAILERHGITRVLASEGGRTSRGSLNKMRAYVTFLNNMESRGLVDLEKIETHWISCVHAFFAGKPFTVKLDSSHGTRYVIRDIIRQAEARQRDTPGMYYAGAVLQHLVGSKLDCALGIGFFDHNSFSTADAPGGRPGDFFIGDVAVHVTTSPAEAVLERCQENLNDGYKAIMITTQRGLPIAEGLAEQMNLGHRVDIFEIEQFVALNLYEIGKFAADGRKVAVNGLVKRYNEIVESVETDPSLKIEVKN